MLVNLNTGVYERGVLIKNRKYIMNYYLRRGLLWDISSILSLLDNIIIFKGIFRLLNLFVVSKYITLRLIVDKYLKFF